MKRFYTSSFVALLFLIGVLPFQLSAQETPNFQIPNYAPKSPEAAAFLQYGQYPVNLSTGLPGISVPIYTVNIKGYSLPITIDYHASGIKVTQEASWVGLGWNLNYGAQIILSVRDDVDGNTPIAMPTPDAKSYYESHPYAYTSGSILNQNLDKSRVRDVYMFSSPTANGEFYYNTNNSQYIVYPPDAFKIEKVISDIEGNLGGTMFKITDSSGNIYKLKTSEDSYRTLTHHDNYKSAWYADEIVTPNNDKISFKYDEDGVMEEHSFSDRVEIVKHVNNCNCAPNTDTSPSTTNGISGIIHEGGTTITYTKKIREIIFNGGQSKLVFVRATGRLDLKAGPYEPNYPYSTNRLSQIELYNKKNLGDSNFSLIKSYFLGQSYFNPQGADYHAKRLKLDNILVLPQEEGYEFKYNNTPLPNKNSMSQDYYGYYNGKNNSDLIPPHSLTSPFITTVGSADRNIYENYAMAGILTEIKYPTKGWTKFNYEANTYYDPAIANNVPFSLSGTAIGVGPGGLDVMGEESSYDAYTTVCPDTCVQYTTIPFTINNPAGVTAQISAGGYNTLNSNSTNIEPLIHHKYGRVRLETGGQIIYDSDIYHNKTWSETVTKHLEPGYGVLIIEAWGEYMVANGSISFEDIAQGLPVNTKGAGLRVSSIESYDHTNVLLSKKLYSYTTPGTTNATSGRLVNPDIKFDFISDPIKTYEPITSCDLGGGSGYIPNLTYDEAYSISSVGQYGVRGEAVIYEYVKETNVNVLDSSKNGYTLYKFTTGGDWFMHLSVIIPTSWKRGKILEKSDYKTVGNESFILRKEVNNYIEDNSKIANVEGFKLRRSSFVSISEDTSNPFNIPSAVLTDCGVPSTADGQAVFFWYNMAAPWYYLKNTEITETFYTSSNTIAGEIKTQKTYNYNNPQHMQLSSEVTITSNGETLETKYYYSLDSEVATLPAVSQLNAKHMLNVPLRVDQYRNGERINRVTTSYKDWGNGIIQPQTIQTVKGSSTTSHLKTEYTKVEAGTGNVLELKKEQEGILISYIYAYGNRLPVAKLENCAYNTISLATIQVIKAAADSGDEALLQVKLDALRLQFPNALVTTFTYEPLKGVSSITDPRGIKTSYTYDNEARFTTAKDYQDNLIIENVYHYKP